MPEALSSDDLLDHERDRRDEPEAHRQDNQQESGEGAEAEPEAMSWSSCWSQPRRHLVLRQEGSVTFMALVEG